MATQDTPPTNNWIAVPEEIGASFQALTLYLDYVHELAQDRGLEQYRFRLPDHLIPLLKVEGTITYDLSSASDLSTGSVGERVGIAGAAAAIAKRKEAPDSCSPPETRRKFIVKAGTVAALAVGLLTFGLVRPRPALASCSCVYGWYGNCQWGWCGPIPQNRKAYYLVYNTYDTFGSCDAYCFMEFQGWECWC